MTVRFAGIMFHNLKGVTGWSHCNERRLDVALVKDIKYHKRVFKIFDRTHPYCLFLRYNLPRPDTELRPVFIGNGMGFIPEDTVVPTQLITTRLTSEQECIDEINIIKTKQQALDALSVKLKKNAETYLKTYIDMPDFKNS